MKKYSAIKLLLIIVGASFIFSAKQGNALEFQYGDFGRIYVSDNPREKKFYDLLVESYKLGNFCKGRFDVASLSDFAQNSMGIRKAVWNHFLLVIRTGKNAEQAILGSKEGGFIAWSYRQLIREIRKGFNKSQCADSINQLNKSWIDFVKLYENPLYQIDILFFPSPWGDNYFPFNTKSASFWSEKTGQINFAERRCRNIRFSLGLKSYFRKHFRNSTDMQHGFNTLSRLFISNDKASCVKMLEFINADGIRFGRLVN